MIKPRLGQGGGDAAGDAALGVALISVFVRIGRIGSAGGARMEVPALLYALPAKVSGESPE
ncbi:MAG: hypothetical protein H5T84_07160 [Thermoleophilia bacterium]|nr:hypothetical protein [Thermoleophilia bacterium]